VAANGKTVLAKGYGMADLEHDGRISQETIFEAGSVSKQFTAAAMPLLAHEGRLSIDDPVRKYVSPRVPAFDVVRCYGSTAVVFRFGTWPTGICISSLCDATSTTETEFDPAFAT
jgi:CubicO group peptidase (beta-lactamase class C family)